MATRDPPVGDVLTKALVQSLVEADVAQVHHMGHGGFLGKARCGVQHCSNNFVLLKAILEVTNTVPVSMIAQCLKQAGRALKLPDVEYELHGHYAHKCQDSKTIAKTNHLVNPNASNVRCMCNATLTQCINAESCTHLTFDMNLLQAPIADSRARYPQHDLQELGVRGPRASLQAVHA